jgi:hypothetical protein
MGYYRDDAYAYDMRGGGRSYDRLDPSLRLSYDSFDGPYRSYDRYPERRLRSYGGDYDYPVRSYNDGYFDRSRRSYDDYSPKYYDRPLRSRDDTFYDRPLRSYSYDRFDRPSRSRVYDSYGLDAPLRSRGRDYDRAICRDDLVSTGNLVEDFNEGYRSGGGIRSYGGYVEPRSSMSYVEPLRTIESYVERPLATTYATAPLVSTGNLVENFNEGYLSGGGISSYGGYVEPRSSMSYVEPLRTTYATAPLVSSKPLVTTQPLVTSSSFGTFTAAPIISSARSLGAPMTTVYESTAGLGAGSLIAPMTTASLGGGSLIAPMTTASLGAGSFNLPMTAASRSGSIRTPAYAASNSRIGISESFGGGGSFYSSGYDMYPSYESGRYGSGRLMSRV